MDRPHLAISLPRLSGARHLLLFTVLAFSIAVLSFATFEYRFHVENFELASSDGGNATRIEMPFVARSGPSGRYRFTGQLKIGRFAPQVFRIIPDNHLISLTINDRSIDLSSRAEGVLWDIDRGVTVDLSPELKPGANSVEIEMDDFGGNIALNIQRYSLDPRGLQLAVSWFLLCLALFIQFAQLFGISKIRSILYAGIIASSVWSVVVVFSANPLDSLWSDPHRHWAQGIDPFRLDPMSMTDPIMYQIYVGILAKLTLKDPTLIAFYTSLLALFTPWIWYRFFRLLQPDKTIALSGWLALSALPSWTGIYSYFMQETLLLPLLGLALYLSWRCRSKRTMSAFAAMLVVWVLAGLTRGICIPLAAVVCTWLWLEQPDKLKKSALAFLILGLFLGPLAYRNDTFLNFLAPHGVGHLSFVYAKSGKRDISVRYERQGAIWHYGFANPSMGVRPFAPLSDWTSRRTGVVNVEIDIDEGKRDWVKAHNENRLTFRKYLWITGENIIYIFLGPSWPDTNPGRLIEAINYEMRWLWFPATILALWLTWRYRRKLQHEWLLPSVILAWFLVQVVFPISVNEGRYRKPYEGLLVAQFVLLAWVRQKRWNEMHKPTPALERT